MKKSPISQRRLADPSHVSGFTLVELLVTIVIIAALAALSVMGVTRMKFSAAKAGTINQMRQVGIAVLTWGSEKNGGEPFYVANGSGDYSDESAPGPNPALSPGNPAAMLFNTEEPDQGYTTDHTLFFSPFVRITPPSRKDYKPKEAVTGKPWGTYVWYYPFSTSMTAKQSSASGQWVGGVKVHPRLDKRLVMMTDYSRDEVIWKKLYLALLLDGTVRDLSSDEVPTRPAQ